MLQIADLVNQGDAPIVVADLDAIRVIVLNRPGVRNALSRAMRADFARLLQEADEDPAIEALVLTGNGGSFSSGVDLKDRPAGAKPVQPNPALALRSARKPIIAAIDGCCLTGALEMALSCDFAIATPQSSFADTHCKVGLFPRWGGGSSLTSAIGVRRARQMMLTGDFIDARTAHAWGLVNEIAEAGALLDRAMGLARSMARMKRSQPLSFDLHKQMLDLMAIDRDRQDAERDQLALFDTRRLAR